MLDDIHEAGGLLLVIYTGDGWTTDNAWSYVEPHAPHASYITATGLPWMLALPHHVILDLGTNRVIGKDPAEDTMTPAEILAVVQGNDT